jgi:hypothetical protein
LRGLRRELPLPCAKRTVPTASSADVPSDATTPGNETVEPSMPPPSTAPLVPDLTSTIAVPVEPPHLSVPVAPGEWHLVSITGDPDIHVSVNSDELTFRLVGGAEYVPDNPCTEDYRVDVDETPSASFVPAERV